MNLSLIKHGIGLLCETQKYYGNPRWKRSQSSQSLRNGCLKKTIPGCSNCTEHGHMSYRCPRKEQRHENNLNLAILRNPKIENRVLSEHCQQYDSKQSESSHDTSNDDKRWNPGVTNIVIDFDFVKTLDLVDDESPPESEDS